jgi:hypothetical protein
MPLKVLLPVEEGDESGESARSHRRQQREIHQVSGEAPVADRGRGEDEDSDKEGIDER